MEGVGTMKQRGFCSIAIAVCGLAAALLAPARVHADDLIGTGVVMAAVQIGAPRDIQVLSGDEQTGEEIANSCTGVIAAGLYDGTVHLLTPDWQHDIATLYPDVQNSNVLEGMIQYGPLAGAQVTSVFLGFLDELHPEAWNDVKWNGIEVQYYTVNTTISSHSPD
jgi:hypothetical protein